MTQIGIDIGGSGVRGAVVCDGKKFKKIVSRALVNRETQTVVSTVASLIRSLNAQGPVGVSVLVLSNVTSFGPHPISQLGKICPSHNCCAMNWIAR